MFSGLEAAALDVVFLRDSDPVTAQLARVGLGQAYLAAGDTT